MCPHASIVASIFLIVQPHQSQHATYELNSRRVCGPHEYFSESRLTFAKHPLHSPISGVQRPKKKAMRCWAFVTEFACSLANPASSHVRAGLGMYKRQTLWCTKGKTADLQQGVGS